MTTNFIRGAKCEYIRHKFVVIKQINGVPMYLAGDVTNYRWAERPQSAIVLRSRTTGNELIETITGNLYRLQFKKYKAKKKTKTNDLDFVNVHRKNRVQDY